MSAAPPPVAPPRPPTDPRFSLDRLDRSVDPGDDFYRFAVGSWSRANPVPPDRSRWGAFDELTEANYRILYDLLEEAGRTARDPAAPPTERRVGDFYASALDTGRRNAAGFAPIQEDLRRLDAIHDAADVVRAVAALHDVGTDALFSAYVAPDKRASGFYALYLEQGGLSLPDREYYLDPRFADVRRAFEAHVARLLRLAGEDDASAAASAAAVLAIETELARAGRSQTDRRDEERNYHRRERAELEAAAPRLGWAEYLRARGLGGIAYAIVGQPEFFDALDRLLAERPAADWRRYLRWTVVHAAAPFLHEAAEGEDFDFFHRTLLGQPEPEPAWKRAALVLDDLVGEALGALYVARAFPPEARARMQEMVDDLCAAFRERLAGRDWMSPGTRERALEKFARFRTKIGHPAVFRDYTGLVIDRADFAGNVRRARSFEVRRQTARVGGPVDRSEWGMTPPTVNAYFSPVLNEIVFPAGILQPPFFDVAADDAVNYGGIGAVIGHEITHGYDDQGRKYDADGNLADWWTPADAAEFDRRAHQVVEQYNAYRPLPDVAVNGALTLGENLADLGGVRIAFAALQARLARDPTRRRTLDGFTPEQRFFLSWAQVWRLNCREPEIRRRAVVDPHAPGPFRAAGAVVNHDAFFEAFGIGPDRPMWRPPSARVAIW